MRTSPPDFFAVVTTNTPSDQRRAREAVALKVHRERGGGPMPKAPPIRVYGCGQMGPQHDLVLVTSYEISSGSARELLLALSRAPELEATEVADLIMVE